jgi:hypothetical protein
MEDGIFIPNGKDILDEYPELNDYEVFKSITKLQRDFVWWYACKSSAAIHIESDQARFIYILKKLPEFKKSLTNEEFENYSELNFPPSVNAAIEQMRLFSPIARAKARTMVDTIFTNMEKMVRATMPTELQEQKIFIDIQLNIAKNIPSLLAASEQGYGYKAKSEVVKLQHSGDIT